jgi:hypothetical protein
MNKKEKIKHNERMEREGGSNKMSWRNNDRARFPPCRFLPFGQAPPLFFPHTEVKGIMALSKFDKGKARRAHAGLCADPLSL